MPVCWRSFASAVWYHQAHVGLAYIWNMNSYSKCHHHPPLTGRKKKCVLLSRKQCKNFRCCSWCTFSARRITSLPPTFRSCPSSGSTDIIMWLSLSSVWKLSPVSEQRQRYRGLTISFPVNTFFGYSPFWAQESLNILFFHTVHFSWVCYNYYSIQQGSLFFETKTKLPIMTSHRSRRLGLCLCWPFAAPLSSSGLEEAL